MTYNFLKISRPFFTTWVLMTLIVIIFSCQLGGYHILPMGNMNHAGHEMAMAPCCGVGSLAKFEELKSQFTSDLLNTNIQLVILSVIFLLCIFKKEIDNFSSRLIYYYKNIRGLYGGGRFNYLTPLFATGILNSKSF